MIKYLGSKRRLVPVLGALASELGVTTALDAFTGTTRVAQEFKRRGIHVTAVDTARYAEVFAQCYVELDADEVPHDELRDALRHLDALAGVDGYFTETFCVNSRFFQAHNGRRVDAIRDAIEAYRGSWCFPVLLTSLVEAADRVDSTTGVQMAYLKQWAPRSYRALELRVPEMLAGPGRAIRAEVETVVDGLGSFDLAYFDPPYNQHRYFTNYHIWETLVAWDAPEHYGVACKRTDARGDETRSVFNSKRTMGDALHDLIERVDARVIVISHNDESWLSRDDLEAMCAARGAVRTLAFDSKRYVGAQIGIHNPRGERVGEVSHLRNQEFLVFAGDSHAVDRIKF